MPQDSLFLPIGVLVTEGFPVLMSTQQVEDVKKDLFQSSVGLSCSSRHREGFKAQQKPEEGFSSVT